MAKLKALRGSVGSYGRVSAGGIVDVDTSQAEKLVKSGRFVKAEEADIAAAQEAQKKALSVSALGTGAAFMPIPSQPAAADRLSQMVESGQLSRDKAKELVSLQISLSTEEVQAFIKSEGERLFGEVAAAQAEVDRRRAEVEQSSMELAAKQVDLDAREASLSECEAELNSRLKDLDSRQASLTEAEKALEAKVSAAQAKSAEKSGK